MAQVGVRENEHYVPQFLLRNFCKFGTKQVFVFKKDEEKEFATNVKNICCEKDFYSFINEEGQVLSIEQNLSELESMAKTVIDKIIGNSSISSITNEEREILSLFFSIQFIRTKTHRERKKHTFDSMRDWAKKRAEEMLKDIDISEAEKEKQMQQFEPMDEVSIKNEDILDILRYSKKFLPYFYNKKWALFKTKNKNPFYISENPLVMHNDKDMGPYGNIGLGVPGIQLYFPLSKNICLFMGCPLEFKDMIDLSDVDINEDNVVFCNHLQVVFSETFILSSDGNFNLVKQMIKDNPKFKTSLKPTIG